MAYSDSLPKRARAPHRSPWVLVAWLVTIAGCGRGDAPAPAAADGPRPPRDTGRPILLVHAAGHDAEGGAAGATAAWIDLLTREFGSCDWLELLELEADPAGRLAGRRVLVLTRTALQAAPPSLLSALEERVENGLTVIGERPDTNAVQTFGLRIAATERSPRTPWPFAPTLALAGVRQAAGAMAPVPLARPIVVGRYAPGQDPRRRAMVVADVAARPALWGLQQGAGAWVAIAHEIGTWTADLGAFQEDHADRDATVDWSAAWIALVADRATVTHPWPRFAPLPFPALASEVSGSGTPADPVWWEARERSRLDWSWDGGLLRVEVTADGAAVEGLAITLPRRWRDRHLVDWEADWSPSPARASEPFGVPVLHVGIEAGVGGTLVATYR